jgi:L,D-transpeptidase ErfK/SrfK
MLAMSALAATPGWAATYRLPAPGNDIVGAVSVAIVVEGETLIDIARTHGLGYQELMDANRHLDPWLPPTGAEVVLPTRYVLPSAPRRGIIVNIAEMRLYYYPPPEPGADAGDAGVVVTFPIGIGEEGFSTPLGITRVVAKAEDPPWVVPASILAEYERAGTPLPRVVPPGPDNPLGRHSLRLGWSSYLIHGTNKAFGIGMRVSHGCIRMYPEDVEQLFHMVPVSTPVWVIDQPSKLGREDGRLYLEAHAPVADPGAPPADHVSPIIAAVEAVTAMDDLETVRATVTRIARQQSGLPEPLGAAVTVRPPAQADGWMLQFGAFSNKGNASRLADELAALGAAVSVQAHSARGYCHVLVGPYADRDAAREALAGYAESTGQRGEILPADRPGLFSECVL